MDDMKQLHQMLDASTLPPEKKQEALLFTMSLVAPLASQQAATAAGGDFLQILMQLLIQFLPILLKLLAGG